MTTTATAVATAVAGVLARELCGALVFAITGHRPSAEVTEALQDLASCKADKPAPCEVVEKQPETDVFGLLLGPALLLIGVLILWLARRVLRLCCVSRHRYGYDPRVVHQLAAGTDVPR